MPPRCSRTRQPVLPPRASPNAPTTASPTFRDPGATLLEPDRDGQCRNATLKRCWLRLDFQRGESLRSGAQGLIRTSGRPDVALLPSCARSGNRGQGGGRMRGIDPTPVSYIAKTEAVGQLRARRLVFTAQDAFES